ncbi:RlpA-like double-psi beta-barrel domain-containing protein [Deinococcus hopiensis]|uniref:Rare lipoprotein A n=1 Tax=Deinococcus hopiensis KR-140 TaxID=695939 RepID=A0A1W1VGL4_9DEIO|nr:RlpA-like double-psi beta-barrel domain-containing protein [Deinococcus hopiensis]SMB92539.1 rare lipoprotein A [Deinococcus hopiensis KR-140]
MKLRALVLAGLMVLGSASAAGTYRVRSGDSLWTVARAHGTTVTALRQTNPGVRTHALQIGQRLRLPARTVRTSGQHAPDTAYQRGLAVWYGGRYNRHTRMTAAHRTLPLGSWVRVTLRSGHSVDVLINDRGPYGSRTRVIDLSRTAASRLGILSAGRAAVTVRVLSRP